MKKTGKNEGKKKTRLANKLPISCTPDFFSLTIESLTKYLSHAVFAKSANPETFGQFIFWNEKAETLFGIKAENILGKTDFDLFTHEQASLYRQKDKECLNTSHILEIEEEPLQLKSRKTKWIKTVKVPVRDEKGAPFCVLCMSDDITGKKMRKNHRLSDRVLQALTDEPSLGIAVMSLDGRIQEVNPTFTRLFHRTRTRLSGLPFASLLHEDSREEFKQASRKIAHGQPHVNVRLRCGRSDGSLLWVQATFSLLKSEEGTNLLVIFSDITELVAACQDAEDANKARGTFFAEMSHEFRVPLNTIIAPAEMLREDITEDEQKEYIEMIHHSAQDLLALVNDFLDYSRIESGSLSLKNTEFDLPVLIENITRCFHLAAKNKEIELRSDIATSVPSRICADPMRLMQILNNLLDNAVKFTERGYVELRVSMDVASKEEKGRVFFRVKDTGEGIPPEVHRKLFQPFVQANSAIRQKCGGSGLGLAITKRLCELMGGSISYKSQMGVGSTFEFWIPVKYN